MGFFTDIQRRKKIKKLSERLGQISFNRTNEDDIKDLNKLYILMENDPELKGIMYALQMKEDELPLLYRKLVYAGAGQWVKHHYIPVASFLDPEALTYLIKNKDAIDFEEIAFNLIDHFEYLESYY